MTAAKLSQWRKRVHGKICKQHRFPENHNTCIICGVTREKSDQRYGNIKRTAPKMGASLAILDKKLSAL